MIYRATITPPHKDVDGVERHGLEVEWWDEPSIDGQALVQGRWRHEVWIALPREALEAIADTVIKTEFPR